MWLSSQVFQSSWQFENSLSRPPNSIIFWLNGEEKSSLWGTLDICKAPSPDTGNRVAVEGTKSRGPSLAHSTGGDARELRTLSWEAGDLGASIPALPLKIYMCVCVCVCVCVCYGYVCVLWLCVCVGGVWPQTKPFLSRPQIFLSLDNSIPGSESHPKGGKTIIKQVMLPIFSSYLFSELSSPWEPKAWCLPLWSTGDPLPQHPVQTRSNLSPPPFHTKACLWDKDHLTVALQLPLDKELRLLIE